MPDDSDDYLWDRSGAPDPEVARLEQLLAPLRHDAPLDELRVQRSARRRRPGVVIALGVALVAAAAVVVLVIRPSHSGSGGAASACRGGTGFAFTGQGGDVTCSGARIASGVLPVGGELDTGANG